MRVYIKKDLIKLGDYKMAAVAKAKSVIEDYSEAAYVDSQYEYLQEHKSDGISLEELKRRRAIQHPK